MSASPWSGLGDRFLSEGDWSIGQGTDAPDRRLLRTMITLMKPKSLLEVGCGPGIEIDGLEEANLLRRLTYIGVDFTPELIESCATRFPGLRFELADVQYPLPARAEFVWCRHVLEHVEDGLSSLANLYAAAETAAIVSWFIRPTWRPDEIGRGYSEGFLHQTYGAKNLIGHIRGFAERLYRFDFDHHLTRCSVWVMARKELTIVTDLHRFVSSPDFLHALIDVPEDPRELQLRETIRNAEASIRHARLLVDPEEGVVES